MTYSSTILADSPSAYYAFNETSGTTANDTSGNSLNGTLHGTVTVNQTALLSALGTCFLFDGSSGYISLPNGARQAAPVTFECWFEDNSISSEGLLFSATKAGMEFGWDVGSGNVVYIAGNGGSFTTGSLTSGTIYYIAMTVDGSMNFTGYYAKSTDSDVTALGSANPGGASIAYGANELDIGQRSGGLINFKGWISNAAIYPVVLSHAQAKAHFLAGASGTTTSTRTITSSAALLQTSTRTISTVTAALTSTRTRTITSSASLQYVPPLVGVIPPAIMPVISRGVPAYTNDDFSGAFPASNANNATYNDLWRCAQTPTANANAGALIAPVYLAYDLSGVAAAQKKSCVVAVYNDPKTGAYNYSISSSVPNNIPSDYTIDANTAAGGSLPGSGWVTLATVAASNYHSRQHSVDLTGYNWVRINVTGILGSTGNNNAQLNMDVHDAHLANQDNWIFYGDSICLQAFLHSDSTMPAQINSQRPLFFPLMEDGGIGGLLSTDGANNINTWLPLFSGRYVGVLYGTNDANNSAPGDPSFGPNFTNQMHIILNAILAAGKIPVLPKTICWGNTTNLLANVPVINTALAQLAQQYPTAIVGPDLYHTFLVNQSLIGGDGIHPTLPAGYSVYQALWVNSLVQQVYTAQGGAGGGGGPSHLFLKQLVDASKPQPQPATPIKKPYVLTQPPTFRKR